MARHRLSPLPLVRNLLLIFTLLSFSLVILADDSHFEGFDADGEEFIDPNDAVTNVPSSSPPPSLTITRSSSSDPNPTTPQTDPDPNPTTKTTSFEHYWDEDEFEGFQPEPPLITETSTPTEQSNINNNENSAVVPEEAESNNSKSYSSSLWSYTIEISCVSFLLVFGINYFTGKRQNENLALAWASKFATKDSIFDKNFSLLGIGDKDDSPLLLKDGQTAFKFYASGRRYCQGLLATMELKSRHDLIARFFNLVVPSRDEITIEVNMNEDAMDHVVFALAKKKVAKTMQKEVRDLQRFAGLMPQPSGRKWVSEELAVISESKEVAGDLITDTVLDQVFGDKAFESFGKGFISMHFSDQYAGTHKKVLVFKFALPCVDNMADMTRLVALVPYYIDLIGRYKLSPQARSKTEAARLKVAQEVYKELLNVRQEALQRRKAEKREAAEAKLSAEALHKKEAKERARQMKKAAPKMKMTRGH